MSTNCTINLYSFRLTVKSKQGERYELEIEYTLSMVDEKVTAYGMLEMRGGKWTLLDMTFENAHDQIVFKCFFKDLQEVQETGYASAVDFYEANNAPINGVQSIMDHFKKAI